MSTSKNHQFVEFQEDVVARYMKTVPHMISGLRVDPADNGKRMAFVLKTPDEFFDMNTKTRTKIEYEEEILELYSDREVRIFRQLNKKHIEGGILVEYFGTQEDINTANALTDGQIEELITVKNLPSFKKKLTEITSAATLLRIKDALSTSKRPVSFTTAVEARLDDVTEE